MNQGKQQNSARGVGEVLSKKKKIKKREKSKVHSSAAAWNIVLYVVAENESNIDLTWTEWTICILDVLISLSKWMEIRAPKDEEIDLPLFGSLAEVLLALHLTQSEAMRESLPLAKTKLWATRHAINWFWTHFNEHSRVKVSGQADTLRW